MFPMAALIWLADQGIVHFVIGRYCNYKSNQLMGVNLTAPVVQLQVPFAMLLAVVMLHEKFSVLQAIGTALMLGGSFITQGNAGKAGRRRRCCRRGGRFRPYLRRRSWRRRNRNPPRPFLPNSNAAPV
jgi:drug/metabolite transporter (DMT)-like permease